MNSAEIRAPIDSPISDSDRAWRADAEITASNSDEVNSLPITEAVCSSCFSRSACRSSRAASTDCTVLGISSASTVASSRYAPLAPTRLPLSTSDCTISSMKNGLPPVRS